jgi:2-polyprenyl-3-methyl-5-hydroxy-6-metoxy-1,4-benzoquinol methylase
MRMQRMLNQNLLPVVRKILTRSAYTLRTGYWHTGERCCPDFPDEIFLNQFKVYRFASQFCAEKRVLDVGCGTGYGTSHLAESAKSAVGIDLSRQAIRYARTHYSKANLEFRRMSAESLALADHSFDFVLSTENFEHLRDHRANLREISRVLTDDGMVLLATPNPEMFVGVSNRYHTHEFPYDDLLQMVREFFSECLVCENQLTPPTEEGRRLREERRKRGSVGADLVHQPWLWGCNIDATWLCNTHSFFCLARRPRRG